MKLFFEKFDESSFSRSQMSISLVSSFTLFSTAHSTVSCGLTLRRSHHHIVVSNFDALGKSLIRNENNKGLMQDSCGTPYLLLCWLIKNYRYLYSDTFSQIITKKFVMSISNAKLMVQFLKQNVMIYSIEGF